MRFQWIATRTARAALVGAVLLAGSAGAQEPEATEPEQENCICFDTGPETHVLSRTFEQENRARIGVDLGEAAEVDGRNGVEVMDVVEDGPADDAGIQEGDIITALDGSPLGDEPAEDLVDALGDVEPGATVTLTYYRDGAQRTASVVTEEATGMAFFRPRSGQFDVRVMPRVAPERIRERMGELNWVTPQAFMRHISPGGLELVDLNEGLGAYFDSDEGVLVADIDDDSALGLLPGDVILAIDGRDVRDRSHVRAVLDSYRQDEEIAFRVVRQGRRMDVRGSLKD